MEIIYSRNGQNKVILSLPIGAVKRAMPRLAASLFWVYVNILFGENGLHIYAFWGALRWNGKEELRP